MGDKCCCDNVCNVDVKKVNHKFKKALYIALILNFAMFFIELINSWLSHSLSLQADSIDFLGDSANYAVSLFVLSSAIAIRARASLLKAATMFCFGLWILFEAIVRFKSPELPDSFTMSWVGALALMINASVAFLLYRFREGDSNMQSVWLCSRNDAIGNIAVIVASLAVYFFASKWPDLLVAALMASLSVHSSYLVLKEASKELGVY